MEGRIDVVRPAFEPLYPQAAPGKGPHERDARRGLALARTGRGDAEGVECRMLHRLFPFPDASKRLSNRDSIHAKVLGERGWGFREGKSSSEGFFSLTQTYSIYFSTYPRASYMAPASVIVRGPPMMTRVDISTSSAGKSSSLPIHLAS